MANLIKIYRINEKNESIKYYHSEAYLPIEIKIYYENDIGIRWHIRADKRMWSFYIVEATINPKILSNTIDYITAANFSDFNIAMINFNDEIKKYIAFTKNLY